MTSRRIARTPERVRLLARRHATRRIKAAAEALGAYIHADPKAADPLGRPARLWYELREWVAYWRAVDGTRG